MQDQDLYSGAGWEFLRTQQSDNNERLETIALKNEYWNEALTDKINESYEHGE